MKLKRPNKELEQEIKETVKKITCPVHKKAALVSMPDENEEVQVEACCMFFKKDISVIAEKMRKDFLYRDQKTRERLERERKRGLN